MKKIINQEFEGERPLYCEKDLYMEGSTVHAGESALKETSGITAVNCRFEGKYPLWCCNHFVVKNCVFTPGARAALWYSKDLEMSDTVVDAPKMFREMDGARLRNVKLNCAGETFWSCKNLSLDNVEANQADYIFMHCENVRVNNFHLEGNYSFQWSKNVEIHDSLLNTKDAFWETDNVTVYDSEINGEYLGWHSRNLRLVRCHISGTQPLCYAENLVLEDCTFGEDADLALEYSTVNGTVKGKMASVKNPRSGHLKVESLGELIIDKNIKAPADCVVEILNKNI